MPIYMDVHIVPGIKAKDVAEAHRKDILLEAEYECKCMTYWIDEERENVFCLIEAPGKQAVEDMHRKSHGLIPNKIIEVSSVLVESFLGRIYDPSNASVTADGLKVFNDSSFRTIVLVSTADRDILSVQLGKSKAAELYSNLTSSINAATSGFDGKLVEHRGPGIILSFTSASQAVAFARRVVRDLDQEIIQTLELKIGISAGEPVSKSDEFFGDTVRLAARVTRLSTNVIIRLTTMVKELIPGTLPEDHEAAIHVVSYRDEVFLLQFFDKLDQHWSEPDFGIMDYCHALAMSKSQFYRKCIDLFGCSPIVLIKDYRLRQAREMMRSTRNVGQITFDSGFTSPSYFTKCFKKKFGVQPVAYMDMLHND